MNQKEPEVVLPSKVLSEMEETDASRVLTQKVKIALIAHFVNMVPIERLNIDKRTKDRVAMVDHVYWLVKKNPFHDTKAMFYQLAKQHYKGDYDTRGTAYLLSRVLDKMLEFVIDQVKPDSRRLDEMKVRHVAGRLMERGLATDNDRAMSKGAELLTKVARLDQPESEQVDITKVMFLPPVVTSQVTDVDPNKTPVTDEQALAIINKYNAHQDSKRLAIEERVNTMMAKRDAREMANEIENENE